MVVEKDEAMRAEKQSTGQVFWLKASPRLSWTLLELKFSPFQESILVLLQKWENWKTGRGKIFYCYHVESGLFLVTKCFCKKGHVTPANTVNCRCSEKMPVGVGAWSVVCRMSVAFGGEFTRSGVWCPALQLQSLCWDGGGEGGTLTESKRLS